MHFTVFVLYSTVVNSTVLYCTVLHSSYSRKMTERHTKEEETGNGRRLSHLYKEKKGKRRKIGREHGRLQTKGTYDLCKEEEFCYKLSFFFLFLQERASDFDASLNPRSTMEQKQVVLIHLIIYFPTSLAVN